MKVSVIGTIMRDEVFLPHGERRLGFGGILYNVIALASMMRRADEIAPICYAGRRDLDLIRQRHLNSFHQISDRGIKISLKGTDRSVLVYGENGERSETMTVLTPEFGVEHLMVAADSRATLINFVSGREMAIDSLRMLRSHAIGPIHLDVHNLGLAPGGDSRSLENWRDWLSLVDTVQVNEREIEMIAGYRPSGEEEYRRALLLLMSVPTIRAAVLTLGARGAMIAHRAKNIPTSGKGGRFFLLRYPSLPIEEALDPTGCGDCFASAFMLELLRSENAARAGLLATVLSGLNALGGGLGELPIRASGVEVYAQRYFPEMFHRIHAGWIGEPAE